MPKWLTWPAWCLVAVLGIASCAFAQAASKETAESADATGSLADDSPVAAPPARGNWDTSRVVGTPEPPPPFRGQRAFAKLKFQRPLFLIQEPVEPRRMLVVEQKGKVLAFKHDAESEQTEPFYSIEDHDTDALRFHSKYDENRWG